MRRSQLTGEPDRMKHPPRSPLTAIAALLCGVIAGVAIAACGGTQARKQAPPDAPGGGRLHDDLRALDGQITTDLATLGLTPPSEFELTEMMVAHAVPALPEDAAAAACEPPPVGDGCTDVCTVGDAICKNARQICELADQLAGDAWAAQRCASGKASCERARQLWQRAATSRDSWSQQREPRKPWRASHAGSAPTGTMERQGKTRRPPRIRARSGRTPSSWARVLGSSRCPPKPVALRCRSGP